MIGHRIMTTHSDVEKNLQALLQLTTTVKKLAKIIIYTLINKKYLIQ